MKHLLILAAFLAGGAHAQPGCVTAAASAVTSADGRCWAHVFSEEPKFQAVVMFEFDTAELTPEGMKRLDELAQRYFESDVERLVATAHADRLGDPRYNLELSARRAAVVREYLVERGVLPSMIVVDARGAAQPAAACEGLGEESRHNAKLVACLARDRRVAVRTER